MKKIKEMTLQEMIVERERLLRRMKQAATIILKHRRRLGTIGTRLRSKAFSKGN